MKFSLITPTHNIKYIFDLYESIKNQSYNNWEWVLFLNGGIFKTCLPKQIVEDSRVFIYEYMGENSNIGFIKNKAFNLGTGDVLVEADHDDLLTPDCLQEMYEAFKDSDVGFVYSDNARLTDNDIPFNPFYGWTHREYDFNDKKLISMKAFEPSSHSMAYIWFAPDHIRAWRSSVYKQVGGHDEELKICDDHDLIAKTYLITKIKHIPKVLYIYRIHGENSWLSNQLEIDAETKRIYHKYIRQLAERDAELNNKLKIDLGGGLFPKPGYLTIDKEGADITCDLNNGIPLEDNSVGVMNASHIIEHLKDPLKTMSEIHRVLHHGGWVFIDVPSTDGRGAWQDPTHVSYWNENSFLYYTNVTQAQYIRNTNIRFSEFYKETYWWENNVAITSIHLSCLKEGYRFPGKVEI
jgi:glycosyltransferase involved in cell wall biosynthesis